jgi:hypothetical protein
MGRTPIPKNILLWKSVFLLCSLKTLTDLFWNYSVDECQKNITTICEDHNAAFENLPYIVKIWVLPVEVRTNSLARANCFKKK